MLRGAGLRDAASQAMQDLPDPVDLDQVQAWGHRTASPETISLAARAAAHDAVCRAAGPAGVYAFHRRAEGGLNIDGSAGRKDLAFTARRYCRRSAPLCAAGCAVVLVPLPPAVRGAAGFEWRRTGLAELAALGRAFCWTCVRVLRPAGSPFVLASCRGLVGRWGPADRPWGICGLLNLWPLGRCRAGRVIPSVGGVPGLPAPPIERMRMRLS